MKLVTPAIASEPYTADAPPVTISTRSSKGEGTWLISAVEIPDVPGPRRLPSMRTKLRFAPKPRRLIDDVPLAPLDTLEFCPAVTEGRLFNTSTASTKPERSNTSLLS